MSLCLAEPLAYPPIPDTPARRGGGPRTVEGKDASRRNALKRGLRSRVVFPDDLTELVDKRMRDFFAEFSPRSTYEETLVRDMAVSSVRFERCASLSIADLVRVADRAELCWEQDRRMAVENIASRISKDPGRVARRLRNTRQGTDLLMEYWETLVAIAKETGRWDDDQRRLAFDLLGVPRELRNVTSEVPGDDETAKLIALAESEIVDLREYQESVLDDLDDAERAMAMAGMPLEEDAASARLRKDEARARNDFAKARNDLSRHREGKTFPEVGPNSLPTNNPTPPSKAAVDNPVPRPQVTAGVPAKLVSQVEVAEESDMAEEPEITEESTPAAPNPAERPKSRSARKELQRRARAKGRREAGTR